MRKRGLLKAAARAAMTRSRARLVATAQSGDALERVRKTYRNHNAAALLS